MSTPPSGGWGQHDPATAGQGSQSGWQSTPPEPPGGQGAWGAPGPQGQGWGNDHGQGYGPATREHAPGAVGSLVCGILGLFTIPVVLSIVAVVLGNQSKRATAADPNRYNDQLGQVGRILGWIGIALGALGVIAFLLALALFIPVGG